MSDELKFEHETVKLPEEWELGKPMPGGADLFQRLRGYQEDIHRLPPVATALLAHYEVPRDRVFRQWDTRGRLFIWINRRVLEAIPHEHRQANPGKMTVAVPWGIPIHYMDES